MDIFTIVLQVAGVLAAVGITGIGVVPLTNFLKGVLKLDGNAAKWLSIAVAVILGVSEAIVAGRITEDMFTLEGIAGLIAAVWLISQEFYKEHYKAGVA